MFVSNLASWLYFYEHLSRRMLLIVCNVWGEKIQNLSFSHRAVVQSVTCGFVWLTENCFSSCFIMAQGGKQKTENIFRTPTADCFSGGQSFNPSYVTCAVQIFGVEERRKWYRQQQSFFIINIYSQLNSVVCILLIRFCSGGCNHHRSAPKLHNYTHTCPQQPFCFVLFCFFFTRFCLPVIPQDFPCLSFFRLSWFLIFLSLVTQHKQTLMYQTKRSFQCIKSEIQSLVPMCAPCPLPRLNICLSVIPWWVVAHKKTGQSLYPCPPLSSPSPPSQWINTETNWPSSL